MRDSRRTDQIPDQACRNAAEGRGGSTGNQRGISGRLGSERHTSCPFCQIRRVRWHAGLMDTTDLAELAALFRRRNILDQQIGRLINRPMTAGHAGEWIASRIFDIELEPSAAAKAIDGRFRAGALAGNSVNVKWYLKREGLLDMTEAVELDYYLVLTGPKATGSDVRTVRAWRIDAVYLFDAQQLLTEQRARGVRVGVASGVLDSQWLAAEIYPTPRNPALPLTHQQRHLLAQFSG